MAVPCCNCKLPIHDEECAWACGEIIRAVADTPQWRELGAEYGRYGRNIPGAAILTLGSFQCRRCHQRTWEEYEPASGRAVPADDMPAWVRLAAGLATTTFMG
jgi:hypothetical protein